MDKNLNKLTKKELIQIISKFKKESLISFILNKKGGENNMNNMNNENKFIKTNNAIRKFILFNKNKSLEKENNVMANNNLYNKIYDDEDDEDDEEE